MLYGTSKGTHVHQSVTGSKAKTTFSTDAAGVGSPKEEMGEDLNSSSLLIQKLTLKMDIMLKYYMRYKMCRKLELLQKSPYTSQMFLYAIPKQFISEKNRGLLKL